jgi:hypothetical protein
MGGECCGIVGAAGRALLRRKPGVQIPRLSSFPTQAVSSGAPRARSPLTVPRSCNPHISDPCPALQLVIVQRRGVGSFAEAASTLAAVSGHPPALMLPTFLADTAAQLITAAVIWVRVNGPVERPVLLVLTPFHGITLADLPSLAALVIAGLLLVLA